jgi:hypothetical protein
MSHRTFDDPGSIEARQALLDNRCEHAGKRHRVRKRFAKRAAKNKAAVAHKVGKALAAARRQRAAVRAFWAEEVDEYPA